MKQSILRYGIYSIAVLIGVNLLFWLIFGIPEPDEYRMGEIVGYTTIIVSLLFVFLGIKYYRDEHNGGKIKFWKAVGLGLGIALLPSIAFAVYNFIYMEWMDPAFAEKYMVYALDKAQATMNAADFESYKASMEKNKSFFTNSAMQSVVMFFTVFILGVIISLVSSLILKKKEPSLT